MKEDDDLSPFKRKPKEEDDDDDENFLKFSINFQASGEWLDRHGKTVVTTCITVTILSIVAFIVEWVCRR